MTDKKYCSAIFGSKIGVAGVISHGDIEGGDYLECAEEFNGLCGRICNETDTLAWGLLVDTKTGQHIANFNPIHGMSILDGEAIPSEGLGFSG